MAASTPVKLAGDWYGSLDSPLGISIPLVLHFRPDGATLDSPDQAATGIPVDARIDGNRIEIDATSIGATFIGRLSKNKRLEGTFTQGGVSMPLEFSDQRPPDRPIARERPQDPRPPIEYGVTEVLIKSTRGVTLSGTLTHPPGNHPCPAVILVPGSGRVNRDEEVAGHRPFLVLADHLTRSGFAVLRLDKRGVGASTGRYETATPTALIGDIHAAIAWLRVQKGIDQRRIGLIGHSEGAALVPAAAAESKWVAFLVLLSPPGVSGDKIVVSQKLAIDRKIGLPVKERREQEKLERRLIAAAKAAGDSKQARGAVREVLRSFHLPPERSREISEELSSNPFRMMLTYDPVPYLRNVHVPVLVVAGDLDLQVIPSINLPPIRRALSKNKNSEIVQFAGLNHLLQPATTGLPQEYGAIPVTIDPSVLAKVSSWMTQVAAGPHVHVTSCLQMKEFDRRAGAPASHR